MGEEGEGEEEGNNEVNVDRFGAKMAIPLSDSSAVDDIFLRKILSRCCVSFVCIRYNSCCLDIYLIFIYIHARILKVI